MRLQMYRTFKIIKASLRTLKEMPHYFNIIFRVYALQSKTDLDKSIDPKVMQLNRRDRKVSFEKLFRVYVFHATLRLLFFITNVWSINICLIINCYYMFYYLFFTY